MTWFFNTTIQVSENIKEKTENQRQPRLGRPPASPDKVRSKRVVTFITRPEMKSLEELTLRKGQTISAMCHRIISEYLKKQPN